ncbi:MAG: hypothetical protein OEZ36_09275, partial [Spirochaetota bacterium]|nr:hypothetical protein [Spirochaetota bacterium]
MDSHGKKLLTQTLEDFDEIESYIITNNGDLEKLRVQDLFVGVFDNISSDSEPVQKRESAESADLSHLSEAKETDDLSEFYISTENKTNASEQFQAEPEKQVLQPSKKTSDSLLTLLESEKKTLEQTLAQILSPYFVEEINFLDHTSFQPSVKIKDIENIHQKLLYLRAEGQSLSETTYRYLGSYYYLTYRNYEGIKLIESFIGSADDEEYFHNLLGNYYYHIGLQDKAKESFHLAIEAGDNLAAPHFSLGYLFAQDKDYHKALYHFTQAEKVFRDNPNFMSLIAESYEAEGVMDKAIVHYERRLKYKENNNILLKLVELCYELGLSTKTLFYIDKALKNKLKIPNLTYKLAVSYFLVGQREMSAEKLSDLLNIDDKPEGTVDEQVLALFTEAFHQGIYDAHCFKILEILTNEMGISFQSFLDKEIRLDEIRNPSVLLTLARQFQGLKKYRTSAQYLRQILSKNKHNYQALKELGKIYHTHSKSKDKGIDIFIHLAKKDKTDGEIDCHLGLYYYEQDNWDMTIQYLQRATEKNYHSHKLFEALGESYFQLNDRQNAKQAFQSAFEMMPQNLKLAMRLAKL